DPFALRRGALGIIRISLRNTNRFNLKAAINKSLSFYPDYKNPDKIATEVFDFFKERLKQLRLAKGYQYDLVEAALESDWNDIRDVEKRMDALVAVSKRESFNDLMITFKRASRILPKERLSQSRVSENLLQEAAEKKLFECFREISEGVEPLLHVQKYQAALAEMVKLKPSLDTFFDQVMVMDEDARLRENRLALLNNITNLFGQVADVSKIVI
ncbi:MAG: glycine--tRNA ligase subunit beta, partial [bacterium]